MPTPRLSDELARQAVELVREHGSVVLAADAIGMSRNTFSSRYQVAKRRGFTLSEGARDVIGRARLGYDEARGGWIHNYDTDGKKTGTTRWARSDDDMTPEDYAARLMAAFTSIPPAPSILAPEHVNVDLLTLYPIADAHIGMMAWRRETGEDYDTRMATDRLVTWIGRCMAASPNSHTAVILDVGDLLHADDQTNQTPGSKHALDVDTRHFRTIDLTIAAMATAVDLAATKHQHVIVRVLPGNHDKNAYMAILFALAERYRDNPRVQVQKEPGEFFAYQFGKVMLAAHHGDKSKAPRMVLSMADEFPEIWGQTRHRFLWTGHLHHHKSEDIGGVQWEQLRALTARDAYARAHAYSARAQLQAITYHRDMGEVSRVKVGDF